MGVVAVVNASLAVKEKCEGNSDRQRHHRQRHSHSRIPAVLITV